MENSHVDDWCKDKSPIVAQIAKVVVSRIDELEEIVINARDFQKQIPYRKDVQPKEWVKFYKNRRLIILSLLKVFLHGLGDNSQIEAIAKIAMTFYFDLASGSEQRITPYFANIQNISPEDIELGQELGRKIWARFLDANDNDTIADDTMTSSAFPPALQFFVLVWIPCWFECGMFPAMLLKAARRGDQKALEKLLRLDKRAIGDPFIARYIGNPASRKKGEHSYLTDALNGSLGSPDENMLRRRIKIWVGEFILRSSKFLLEVASKLDAQKAIEIPAEIRGLFRALKYNDILTLLDALAKDVTGDRMAQDEDFAGIDPAAFKKQLQRKSVAWHFLDPNAKTVMRPNRPSRP